MCLLTRFVALEARSEALCKNALSGAGAIRLAPWSNAKVAFSGADAPFVGPRGRSAACSGNGTAGLYPLAIGAAADRGADRHGQCPVLAAQLSCLWSGRCMRALHVHTLRCANVLR